MKEIYLSEEDLKNLNEMGAKLFYDEDNPASPIYQRKLERPEINYLSIIMHILLPLLLWAAYIIILISAGGLNLCYIMPALIITIVYVALGLKKAIISCVKIYQRLAPEAIRRRCRFEPSCSEYMLLAIEKYGLSKGLAMGIKRLKRCNINHCGYDYP